MKGDGGGGRNKGRKVAIQSNRYVKRIIDTNLEIVSSNMWYIN